MDWKQLLDHANLITRACQEMGQADLAKKSAELEKQIYDFIAEHGKFYLNGTQPDPNALGEQVKQRVQEIYENAMAIESALAPQAPSSATSFSQSVAAELKRECERLGLPIVRHEDKKGKTSNQEDDCQKDEKNDAMTEQSFPEKLKDYSQTCMDMIALGFDDLPYKAQRAVLDMHDKVDEFVKNHSEQYRDKGGRLLNPTQASLGNQVVQSMKGKLKDIVKNGMGYKRAVGEQHDLYEAPDGVVEAADKEFRRLHRTQINTNALANKHANANNTGAGNSVSSGVSRTGSNMNVNNASGMDNTAMNPFANPMSMSMNNGFGMGNMAVNQFANPMRMSMNNGFGMGNMAMNQSINPMCMSNSFPTGANPSMTRSNMNFK